MLSYFDVPVRSFQYVIPRPTWTKPSIEYSRSPSGVEVEDGPRSARGLRGLTDRAGRSPAESAPLKLRPDLHVVDTGDIALKKTPSTPSELPVNSCDRVPRTSLAACERKESLTFRAVLGDVGQSSTRASSGLLIESRRAAIHHGFQPRSKPTAPSGAASVSSDNHAPTIRASRSRANSTPSSTAIASMARGKLSISCRSCACQDHCKPRSCQLDLHPPRQPPCSTRSG